MHCLRQYDGESYDNRLIATQTAFWDVYCIIKRLYNSQIKGKLKCKGDFPQNHLSQVIGFPLLFLILRGDILGFVTL